MWEAKFFLSLSIKKFNAYTLTLSSNDKSSFELLKNN